MKTNEIKKHIENLVSDLEFSYNGIDGSICPISRHEIYLSYGEQSFEAKDIEEAMSSEFIAGKSIENIGEQLIIY